MLCADLCHKAYIAINKTDTMYTVCGRIFFTHFYIIPPPGLACTFPKQRNFSRGARFSNKNFPELAPQKNVSAHLNPDPDRAAAFSKYLVNDDQEQT